MTKLVDDWLPKPTILHPWPGDRFAVTHPRWEPYAGKPPERLCAGARGNPRPYRSLFLGLAAPAQGCSWHSTASVQLLTGMLGISG